MPLFSDAPDYLLNNSKLNLRKPEECDIPYIDIEPRTGAIFHANASLQVNSPLYSLPKVDKNSSSPLFNLSDGLMLPIYILTYSDEVTDGIASTFRNSLKLADILSSVSIILGSISTALFCNSPLAEFKFF